MPDDPTGLLDDRLRAGRIALDRVPVIDLGPLRAGGDTAAMAAAIRHALTHIGFMYVRGHGVPREITRRAYAAARDFFALPEAERMALHITGSGAALHGYTERFGENNDPGRTIDLKEIFDLGREAADGCIRPFFGATPWPPALPGFRTAMMAHHDAMLGLGRDVMAAIALSLELPRDHFEPMMQEPISIQRVLHYPPQVAVRDDRMIGIGAHTDYGCLTVLSQDASGGLQVMNRDGRWIEAPPIPDTFVINIGDMMQRLTNDLYLANLHRVINVSGRARYSMPFFFDFDHDTEVAPIDACTGPGNPPRYAPVVCGRHKWARYAAAYPDLGRG
ncbi:isopenicillin N synthase family oxygenase [Maritimibacter sp. 55A14]|uniref:isopenicillin N synthase family dioxygenase n=1 Tax=Maritimibacter sp. 55A14 TaxID=2174844 RepID=UPI000D60F4BA|nr:2OG-Fe(II) oxygenase family protein [Maritimibacter sp. 55A14]PWE33856.1 isopenicillin N synthase family oxygenase [Maritimibacter sp. 55A14]